MIRFKEVKWTICQRSLLIDDTYNVSLLDFSSPKILDVKEHKFIHLLNSLKPNGLNIENPLSVPLLHR